MLGELAPTGERGENSGMGEAMSRDNRRLGLLHGIVSAADSG